MCLPWELVARRCPIFWQGKVAEWGQAIDRIASVGANLVESRRNSLPKRLRPGLSVSAGHAYVPMPEDHLHPVQRHPVGQKSRGACIAQSVLQSVSASLFDDVARCVRQMLLQHWLNVMQVTVLQLLL